MLDLEQIKNLTPAQKDRYMALERMFATDGWRIVTEHVTGLANDAAERELNAVNWETNRVWHGARAALLQMANMQDVTEKEFAALAANREEAQQDEDETKFE